MNRSKESDYIFSENVPPNAVRYLHNITIIGTNNFGSSSNLYVHYFIDMNSDWEISSPDSIEGFTHQSQANNNSNNFSHSFTLDILKSLESSEENSLPLILFEVFQVGLFNRQKAVGYGFTHLPGSPGPHRLTVPTWCPYVEGVSQQLEDYFLSLRPQIENLSYLGRPDNDPVLGRFPFIAETSGNVKLQIETMVQTEKCNSVNLRKDNLQHSKKLLAVDEVIQLYQKAKRRLEETQKALLP